MGLTGCYRKFIPGYGKICQQLYNLTKNDEFQWSPKAALAFEQPKITMTSPQLLALRDFSAPFVIECDASGSGICVVLQEKGRPIALTNKSFSPRNQAFSTYEKELIAIVHATQKWQNFLQGNHFIIKTDHSSLKHFFEPTLHSIPTEVGYQTLGF